MKCGAAYSGGRPPKTSKGGNRGNGNVGRAAGVYGDLSASGELHDWDLTDPASWLTMKRLMKGRQVALTAAPDGVKCHETHRSLGHEPRYVPSYNAIPIANRAHFGEILNDARSVGLRLREQSRPQTKAFDGQPWIPDGLGNGKSSLQGGEPALRFSVPHEGLSIARMHVTHLDLARPQMHAAFHTGLYQADGPMRLACACQRGRQCSGKIGVDGIVAVAFDNLLAN